jgi:hypothetical protein
MANETCTECSRLIKSSKIQGQGLSNPGRYDVFHEACDNCHTPTDNLKLCHLLPPPSFQISLVLQFSTRSGSHFRRWFRRGSFNDIHRSQDCDFHRLIYQATKAYVNAMKPEIIPISSLQFSLVTYTQHDISTSYASMAIEANGDGDSASFDAFRVYPEDFEQVQAIIDRVPVSRLID